jgi:putative drug exporter of the RND superfamily
MRRRILPLLSILVWVAFLAVAGGYAGRLGDAVQNDDSAFLPSGAQATLVARLLPDSGLPAVVVYQRPAGLEAADRAAVEADVASFAGLPGVAGPPAEPVASADGQALEVVVPLRDPAAVAAIRARAASHPGLTADPDLHRGGERLRAAADRPLP